MVTVRLVRKLDDTRVAGAMAAGCWTLLSMGAIGWKLIGKVRLGDWSNYQAMYERGGGYLVRQERDPLFIWIIDRAWDLFRAGGYETFRLTLFALFAFIAAVVAFGSALEGSNIFAVVLIVIDAFAVKSLVQIREGLAFAVILLSLIPLFRRQRGGMAFAGVGCIAALFIHAGTFVFVVVWVFALLFCLLPARLLNARSFPRWATLFSVVAGLGMGFLAKENTQILRDGLHGLGADTSQEVVLGLWKGMYWIVVGAAVVVVRAQIITNANCSRADFGYVVTLGAGLIPLLYVICLVIVFSRFEVAAVAAMTIRMFLSAMELGLLVIALQGRANALTGSVAFAALADQARLILMR
jgi:hypothetical protein